MRRWRLRLTLLGIGAMNSPRYPPAGLLVAHHGARVMLDGGPGAEPAPDERIAAWLVTDAHGELRGTLRALAAERGLVPEVGDQRLAELQISARPVVHTSHPAFGYLLRTPSATAAWAPEFWEFPDWVAGVDLLFAEASGWDQPIRFARGVGGHLSVMQVAAAAVEHGVRRVVFAHLGRPTLRALDLGKSPPFGELGRVGRTYVLPGSDR